VTSHLSGLFHRTSKLLEFGIEPVYVFDGKPPIWKKKTQEAREKIREEARKKWAEAVEKGEEAIKYAQASSRLTGNMIDHAKELLDHMGIPWIQAPSEGEAQAAHMCKQGLVWAAGSQDWDSLLFASPRFVRNLTVSGRKKLPGKQTYVEVNPELIDLEHVKKELGINEEQIILLGILIGTDFNPGGIKGVGPKTALKLVKQHKTLENIAKNSWGTVLHDAIPFTTNLLVQQKQTAVARRLRFC